MEEEDKVGVMVVVEAGLAAAAAMTGTPVVAAAAGFVPMIDYYLDQVRGRKDNVADLVEGTVEAVGATPEEFLAWIKADKRHLALFHDAVEGAWSTFEQDRVEALKRVLADGYRDHARIDVDTMVVKALGDMDPPHVQVLAWLRTDRSNPSEGDKEQLSHLAEALRPILSALERQGCVREEFPGGGQYPFLRITEFGRECLAFLTGEQHMAVRLDG